MPKISQRLQWAVDKLAVEPGDHLLEIGCGQGVVVSAVCPRLQDGTITAIDRSETMIAMAKRKNQLCVASGKARFQTVALEDATFDSAQFDKVFAIRVGLFRTQPARALGPIRHALRPGGSLYLFDDPPVASKVPEVTDQLVRNLQANDFAVRDVLIEKLDTISVACVIAQPA